MHIHNGSRCRNLLSTIKLRTMQTNKTIGWKTLFDVEAINNSCNNANRNP